MSGRKEVALVAVASAPALAFLILHQHAWSYMASWDVRPGAPEAPLSQRIVVASYNWVTRIWPFVDFAAAVLVLPIAVLVLARALAKSPDRAGMRRRCAIWAASAIGAFAGTVVVERQLRSAQDVGSLASMLVACGTGHWLGTWLAAPALANAWGALSAEGQLPQKALAIAVLLAAAATGGWGIVVLLLALQAWLFIPEVLLQRRPTTYLTRSGGS